MYRHTYNRSRVVVDIADQRQHGEPCERFDRRHVSRVGSAVQWLQHVPRLVSSRKHVQNGPTDTCNVRNCSRTLTRLR